MKQALLCSCSDSGNLFMAWIARSPAPASIARAALSGDLKDSTQIIDMICNNKREKVKYRRDRRLGGLVFGLRLRELRLRPFRGPPCSPSPFHRTLPVILFAPPSVVPFSLSSPEPPATTATVNTEQRVREGRLKIVREIFENYS
nr:hypothetical protein Iba_chr04eCG2010 [Ipomoea batatas]